ncbi:MAG: helix-turn-helix domain-containing protein [Acidobacteriota bacterium]
MQRNVELISASGMAAAMLHPVRMRLLEEFRRPCSAAEASRALELPRQRIGHHVRLLREKGLLRQVGERRKGNFVERLLQTTARAYVIAPQALGAISADLSPIQDRFSSAYLAASAIRIIRDLAELRRMAKVQGKKLATLTLETEVRFRSPADQSAFTQELAGCLAELTRKYHHETVPEGRTFRFTVGGHPTLPEESLSGNQKDSNHAKP